MAPLTLLTRHWNRASGWVYVPVALTPGRIFRDEKVRLPLPGSQPRSFGSPALRLISIPVKIYQLSIFNRQINRIK